MLLRSVNQASVYCACIVDYDILQLILLEENTKKIPI